MLIRHACWLVAIPFAVFVSPASIGRADDAGLDTRMYHDPELPIPKIVRVYPENLLPLWLVALGRPEADYQCRAALTIVLAHQEGMKDLERTIHPLLEILEQPNHHPF